MGQLLPYRKLQQSFQKNPELCSRTSPAVHPQKTETQWNGVGQDKRRFPIWDAGPVRRLPDFPRREGLDEEPSVNTLGKPYEGKLHVRFDEKALETYPAGMVRQRLTL